MKRMTFRLFPLSFDKRGCRLWLTALCVVVLALTATGCGSSRDSASEGVRDSQGLTPDERLRFNSLFLEAVRQREKENYDAEYELLKAALEINPDASEALYEMGQLMISFSTVADTTRRAEGTDMLRRAIALDSSNLYYKETLANILARQGKFAESIALYQEMVEKEPTSERLFVLTSLQEESGDLEGAIASLDKLELIEGKDERYSMEKFKLYYQLDDYDRAYDAIEALCEEYPTDLRYRVLLGDLYYQNGKKDTALVIYRDVLAKEPGNSLAQISLMAYYQAAGQDSLYQALVKEVVLNPRTMTEAKVSAMRGYVVSALQTEKDTAEVLGLFRQALELPQDTRGLGELCAYYMTKIGMPTMALQPVMEKILEVEPDYERARLQMLDILLRKDDMGGVAALCNEGHRYNPTEAVYYYYESMAYVRLDNYEAALKAVSDGVEHIGEPTNLETASDMYVLLGDINHELGKKEAAYAAYEEALKYASDNMLCLNNYAYFLSLDGERLDYAASMSLRTVNAEPQNATYLDTYAWILFKQEQFTQARIYIDQALSFIESDEEDSSIYDHAGDIYFRCGETAAAVDFWKKALKLTTEKAEKEALQTKIRNRAL